MVIKQGDRVYTNTPETYPDWERFRPAGDHERGEDVVEFKAMHGRWKYDGSVTPIEIIRIVANACKDDSCQCMQR